MARRYDDFLSWYFENDKLGHEGLELVNSFPSFELPLEDEIPPSNRRHDMCITPALTRNLGPRGPIDTSDGISLQPRDKIHRPDEPIGVALRPDSAELGADDNYRSTPRKSTRQRADGSRSMTVKHGRPVHDGEDDGWFV